MFVPFYAIKTNKYNGMPYIYIYIHSINNYLQYISRLTINSKKN